VSFELHSSAAADRQELLSGLLAPHPFISPKFFYDALGSRLFAAITELDEYYPTRTEASIMAGRLDEIATAFGAPGCTLIDLGAGDCEKASRLFGALRPRQYVAVDISAQFLEQSLDCLQQRYPDMEMLGVGADFSRKLELPERVSGKSRLFFYPGSSIGNFSPDEARTFLAGLRRHLDESGGLLIGIDLVKDASTLEAAYDDSLGVTAAFNLNVLRHANRVAGTDFAIEDWRHVALFDAAHARIEMHVEARRDLLVRWPAALESDVTGPIDTGAGAAGERRFAAGERIHTENSYKYRLDDFRALLERSGFAARASWTDERGWFAVVLARAA
jgi:dimethylhistidine N-methyltransferase